MADILKHFVQGHCGYTTNFPKKILTLHITYQTFLKFNCDKKIMFTFTIVVNLKGADLNIQVFFHV